QAERDEGLVARAGLHDEEEPDAGQPDDVAAEGGGGTPPPGVALLGHQQERYQTDDYRGGPRPVHAMVDPDVLDVERDHHEGQGRRADGDVDEEDPAPPVDAEDRVRPGEEPADHRPED